MAFVAGKKARLLVGDFNLAAYGTSAEFGWAQDALDSTTFTTDGAKTFVLGQDTATGKVSGYYDTLEHADLASWKSSAQAVTFGPSGLSRGSELWMVNGVLSQFSVGSPVAGLGSFSLDVQADGLVDIGVSLHDLTAVTGDENGTSVDGTAATTGGAAAHLHVTAFSGFSGAVVTVEDSANDSTWATIGTFTTVAGVTSQRLAIAGTVRRYTRYVADVTGTGSVTFALGLARR